ncbi:hypothetical protein [Olleya sp. Bg11-27]|uniref:hypothetical protein n=1 Tax=Olleya sp. Bg11-27 TaxID=2058135 RepID=UPI000C312F55|nr:hypothetical protein [Olleya sp. Bg11-27]AUC74278.1 hypothetical protein CW732_00730 [Olleya sp. Bg11-27]
MRRLKYIYITLTFLLISISVFSQEKVNKIYILFDIESKREFSYENGSGNTETTKVFVKEKKNNGKVDFYIEKQLLKFYNKRKELDTICFNNFEDLKFSNIKELRRVVDKKNPLYPYKVFNNIFLVEKLSEDKFLQYSVRWENYIE